MVKLLDVVFKLGGGLVVGVLVFVPVKVKVIGIDFVLQQVKSSVHKVNCVSALRTVIKGICDGGDNSGWKTPSKATSSDKGRTVLIQLVVANI